jgi:hypothetical protein
MGLVGKAASILKFGGVSSARSRESQAKAARAQAKAAKAQAGLAEAETRVAQEQIAAIARALHEDEAHRHENLEGADERGLGTRISIHLPVCRQRWRRSSIHLCHSYRERAERRL